MELVFSEGPEKIPGSLRTLFFFVSAQKSLEEEVAGKADNILFLCFSVPPPLPPGEEGCGMLQDGNVV